MPLTSTQRYLNIAEIKQDTVVLKDGTLRAVILTSSINFSLKSDDEQKALISSYVAMINTLENPLQVLIQSSKIDIRDYIKGLKKQQKAQTNELLKNQTKDYIDFIQEIVTLGNIMTKKFYVVVPFDPTGSGKPGFFKRFFSLFLPAKVIRLRNKVFLTQKAKLDKRVNNVLSGLSSLGVGATRLDTNALIELYYASYNPTIAHVQNLDKLEKMQVELG